MSWEEFVKTPDVAGSVGAVLGWLNAPGGTVKQQLFNFSAGIAAAVYIAPLISERFGWESPAGKIAFSFTVGLCGMNILAKVVAASKGLDLLALLQKGGKP